MRVCIDVRTHASVLAHENRWWAGYLCVCLLYNCASRKWVVLPPGCVCVHASVCAPSFEHCCSLRSLCCLDKAAVGPSGCYMCVRADVSDHSELADEFVD